MNNLKKQHHQCMNYVIIVLVFIHFIALSIVLSIHYRYSIFVESKLCSTFFLGEAIFIKFIKLFL